MIFAGVCALGAAGAVARWQLAGLNRPRWPWGTLLANIAGSFALGAIHGRSSDVITVVGLGLLGSFTTFSTFAGQVVLESDRGAHGTAALYAVTTIGTGVAAAMLGLELS